jgi:hypothetical protein
MCKKKTVVIRIASGPFQPSATTVTAQAFSSGRSSRNSDLLIAAPVCDNIYTRDPTQSMVLARRSDVARRARRGRELPCVRCGTRNCDINHSAIPGQNSKLRVIFNRAAAPATRSRRPALGKRPGPARSETRIEKRIREEPKMATVFSTPAPAHHTPFDHAAREEAVKTPERAGMDSSPSEKAIKNASIVAIVFCVTLLGTISLWLWYGMNHYQNCL